MGFVLVGLVLAIPLGALYSVIQWKTVKISEIIKDGLWWGGVAAFLCFVAGLIISAMLDKPDYLCYNIKYEYPLVEIDNQYLGIVHLSAPAGDRYIYYEKHQDNLVYIIETSIDNVILTYGDTVQPSVKYLEYKYKEPILNFLFFCYESDKCKITIPTNSQIIQYKK